MTIRSLRRSHFYIQLSPQTSAEHRAALANFHDRIEHNCLLAMTRHVSSRLQLADLFYGDAVAARTTRLRDIRSCQDKPSV